MNTNLTENRVAVAALTWRWFEAPILAAVRRANSVKARES